MHGIRDFGKGMFHGITGVIADPISGAINEGASGFFKVQDEP